MKAVDILVSARDRFLSNRDNWTTGRLAQRRASATDGKCFCSIGGVLNAGGGFTAELRLVTNLVAGDYREKNYQAAKDLNGVLFLNNGKKDKEAAMGFIGLLKGQLAKHGFAAKATITALSYLQEAAIAINGPTAHVVGVNDEDSGTVGFYNVIAMFNVAIKNARRRHVNGKRYANDATYVTAA